MNHTENLRIKGMHCASCAGIIERTFKKTEGVTSAEVNYATETAKISYESTKTNPNNLSSKIEKLGYSLVIPETAKDMRMTEDQHKEHLGINQSKREKLTEIKEMQKKVLTVIPLAVFSIFVMGWEILAEFGKVNPMSTVIDELFHHLLPIFATYTLFVVGKPYLLGFLRFLRYGKANMDTLIGIGTTVAFLYSFILSAFEQSLSPYINVEASYYDIAIVVIAFITLGKYLEAKAKIKTGDAIEKLLTLQAKTASVIRDGKETEISINDVIHNDLVVVKPGTRIPVDGIIVDGSSYVDESMITGEPMPVSKKINDLVVSGTINTTGAFTFKATKVGEETMLAQIIKMVENAQSSRAPIQALADKISAVFVPIVIGLSFLALGSWLFLGTATLGFAQALSYGLTSFVGILVIACPCALGLATPTAIIVGVGKGAREGILVKDAGVLEKLYKVDTILVDKTGTITIGKPTLTDIKNISDISDTEFLSILGTLEKKSEHPISHSIRNYIKEKEIELKDVSSFENISGKGIKGIISEKEYFAGNTKLVKDLGLSFDIKDLEKFTEEGKTPVILASKEMVLGFVMVSDEIKKESKKAIEDLHKMGIKVILATGDSEKTAKYIASLVGIDEVIAHIMPQDKLEKVVSLQKEGRVVAMAGDGVNDAPALAAADVGVAMATGTDVAIESAGITLLHGDISKLVKAIKLSKLTMKGIKQNLFWAFFYNVVGIPLAGGAFYPLFGWLLNPVFAGFAMAMSSVSVVGNSLRIKSKKI
ncbi:MAG: cadmium-translocating P-type ATPase [Candidatus Pacebacteria bacterium]|nr:cadmium-translocating P-type ATPase [Candidatus Paceibacterota bacterium]MBP9839400.1 cadmium-translocating P-type ATPase [Candidatus Paceibacterota bacterium]